MNPTDTIDQIVRIVIEAREDAEPLPLVSELVLDEDTRNKMGW